MTEQNYGGRSLAYMRSLIGESQKRLPLAPSVKDLAVRLKPFLQTPVVLTVGDVLLFPDVSVSGDCALYVGREQMLILDLNGRAHLVGTDHYGDTPYYVR